MLNTALFHYLKRQDQRISKTFKSTFIFCRSWILSEGTHFLHLPCQGGGARPCPRQLRRCPQSKSAVPPSHGLNQSQAFQDGIISSSGWSYFWKFHWSEIPGYFANRDRRLNRDGPGQTYGRSNLNQNVKPKSNFRFIRERPFAIPSFHQKCRPGALSPPSRGPDCECEGTDFVTISYQFTRNKTVKQ